MLNSKNDVQQITSIHKATNIASVSLNVANLENQINFYQKVLGMHLHWKDEHQASLGNGENELLHLTQHSDYKRYRGTTGLYHFAVLFPNQAEFARAVARLYQLQVPNAPTDHIQTKATYFDDPEGNGIELYAESPEDGHWVMTDQNYVAYRTDGSLSNGREPMDLDRLFSHLKKAEELNVPVSQKTRIGHVHLYMSHVQPALDFYHGILGFDIMGRSSNYKMAFVSAGGYHHHIGLNAWQGEGAPFAPADALGLKYFTVNLPNQAALSEVVSRVENAQIPFEKTEDDILLYEPSQNGVLLRSL